MKATAVISEQGHLSIVLDAETEVEHERLKEIKSISLEPPKFKSRVDGITPFPFDEVEQE